MKTVFEPSEASVNDAGPKEKEEEEEEEQEETPALVNAVGAGLDPFFFLSLIPSKIKRKLAFLITVCGAFFFLLGFLVGWAVFA